MSHQESNTVDYATRFDAALNAGKYARVSSFLIPVEFPEDVFGTVGEDHVLAQPPPTGKGWYWTKAEVDAWLASDEVAGKGLEAATLADLLALGAEHPE